MTLPVGTLLGPYEILALVGAGGMGEVYRARDGRLNRTVAVKVLSVHGPPRPDVKARFEREAQMLATLSHPHICSVFDVGQQDGVEYLVMEFLEGQTLAERLRRGPLPVEDALKIAIQIADALDKAHRQSVVHRDLKPGNIVLTRSGAKIVDFGLAKLTRNPEVVVGTLSTRTPMTAQGTLLGTLPYMAPEQLDAREADARTDIFAFGAIVYEMVTGRRSFDEKSQASLIAAILDRDPPSMSSLQPLTPPSLERVIKKCLVKDADARWQSAGDLVEELKWIAEGAPDGATVRTPTPKVRRAMTIWSIASTILLAAALVGMGLLIRRPSVPSDEIRFEILVPNITLPTQIRISPDGQWIAFPGTTQDGTGIFLRRFASTTPELLTGTKGGIAPFWSPDSRDIGFFADGRLKTISATGGRVRDICDAPGFNDGTWNADGVIVFSANGVLNRTSAAGGERRPISVRDESKQETGHQLPYFLPDGRRYLYMAWSAQQANRAVYIAALDSTERRKLMDVESKVVYLKSGYLLYQRQGALFAQQFSLDSESLTGEPIRVVEGIAYEALRGDAGFDASENARLIYFAGGGPAAPRKFVWRDRAGRQIGPEIATSLYTSNFDLSPDGTTIAVARQDQRTAHYDI